MEETHKPGVENCGGRRETGLKKLGEKMWKFS